MFPRLTPPSPAEISFSPGFRFRFPASASPETLKGADFSCFFNNCDAFVVQFTRCKLWPVGLDSFSRVPVYYTTFFPACQALFSFFLQDFQVPAQASASLFSGAHVVYYIFPFLSRGFSKKIQLFSVNPFPLFLVPACIFNPSVVYCICINSTLIGVPRP